MARKPRTAPIPSPLLDAVKFVTSVTETEGQPYKTHVAIANGQCMAFNGTIAASAPIPTDLFVAPNATLLLAALSKVANDISITQLDGILSIKSEKSQYKIPCVPFDLLQYVPPDPQQAQSDDKLKEAFTICAKLIREDASPGFANGVILNGPSCVSTDRQAIIEYWHGLSMPTDLIVPKAAAHLVGKITKPLAYFGCSSRSVTFYFNDGSWIKSYLYEDEAPKFNRILNVDITPSPIPKDFWKALHDIESFCEDGNVRLSPNKLHSHSGEAGASYEVDKLPSCHNLNIRYLKIIEPLAKKIDFVGVNGVTYWIGDNCRGAIAGVR